MRRSARAFLGLALIAVLSGAGSAFAAGPDPTNPTSTTPPLPATLFPAGSLVTFNLAESDEEMDEAWNFDPVGEPLMHTYSQSDFLRQSGWMEKSFLAAHKGVLWFVIFDSVYGHFADGRAGSREAYNNLDRMLTKWWQARLTTTQPAHLVPAGDPGASEMRLITNQGEPPILVTAVWWGADHEIEADAFGSPQLMKRMPLRHTLARLVRAAVALDAH